MPLASGSDRATISSNISEMVHAGHPQNQAVAAAMRTAHRQARAYGGRAGFAIGGPPEIPYTARMDLRDELSPTAGGVIASEVPGRTDHVPMSPASNSYVLPADVVSGLGEGSTLAGARVIDEMLNSQPYGIRPPRLSGNRLMPRPPPAYRESGGGYAAGGMMPKRPLKTADTSDSRRPGEVPIMAAGGEYILPPHVVQHHPMLGNGNMERGHRVLDAFVKHVRKRTIKDLKGLPGPQR